MTFVKGIDTKNIYWFLSYNLFSPANMGVQQTIYQKEQIK